MSKYLPALACWAGCALCAWLAMKDSPITFLVAGALLLIAGAGFFPWREG